MKILTKIMIVCLFSLLIGCGSASKTTNTKSSVFKTNQEKIQFLEQYITFERSYEKLDFYIKYQDNSTGMIPGPSEWDICFVAVVPKAELGEWIKGLKKVDDIQDKTCFDEVPTKLNYSKITEWYQSGIHSFVGIDPNNRIVAYRNSSN